MKFVKRHKVELSILSFCFILLLGLTLYLLIVLKMPLFVFAFLWIYPISITLTYLILQNKTDIEKDKNLNMLNSIKIVNSITSSEGEPFDFEQIIKTLENSGIDINCNFKGYITD